MPVSGSSQEPGRMMEGNWMWNDQMRHERAPDDEMFHR
jgi:hypothetical protein